MYYYLGIDAGQSHLEAVFLTEDGNVECRSTGGASHVQGLSMEAVFEQALNEALNKLAKTKVSPKDILAIGAGISGIGIPGKKEAIRRVLEKHFPETNVYLNNDAVASHWGAAKGNDGASILAGTGTIAYGVHGNKICRLSGFGYLFGDEGSGWWIGLTAIQRSLKSSEGRDIATSLIDRLVPYFKVSNIREIPGKIYQQGTPSVKQIASLSQMVADEAVRGDELAKEILEMAGIELGKLAYHLLNKLEIKKDQFFPIYCLGGVFRAGEILYRPFRSYLTMFYPNLLIDESEGNGAVGAALMAKATSLGK